MVLVRLCKLFYMLFHNKQTSANSGDVIGNRYCKMVTVITESKADIDSGTKAGTEKNIVIIMILTFFPFEPIYIGKCHLQTDHV